MVQSLKFLQRKRTVLFHLAATVSIWVVQERSSVMVTPKYLLESATSSCCPWRKYAVGNTFLSLTCGDAEDVALVGVKVHLPSVLPILHAF